ncbi:peptide deformylase [Chitinimonas lacunae]|uniref:Peptide deformylase n=1 Tax=Chitinimonas lacunae TaxID=1963018 RepID=A0ABV8MV00_9NEIS
MPIRPILKMGDPLLWQVAAPVAAEEFGSAELLALIADMEQTMQAASGAGLAAPQIGVSKQLVIFGGFVSPRYPDAGPVPYTVLCNPQIEALDDAELVEDWEGCLSVPGLRGRVPRHPRIRYRGFDPYGEVIERVAADFHARVVQHECDHLFGVLYPMRIRDFTSFGYTDVLFPGQLPAED